MCSNLMIRFATLFFALNYLFSCAGEDLSRSNDFGAASVEISCLEDFGGVLGNFFEGKITEKGISEFWDCAEDAVRLFGDFFEGQNAGYYTRMELQQFLQEYFLGEDDLSDELMYQIMGLKQIFVGGQRDRFTKQELLKGRQFIRRLKAMSVKALPHIRLLGLQLTTDQYDAVYNRQKFNAALKAMDEIVAEITGILIANQNPYTFDDFQRFVDELTEETPGEQSDFSKIIPASRFVKQILVGGSGEQIAVTEWKRFFDKFLAIYKIVLRAVYDFGDRGIEDKAGLLALDDVIQAGLKELDDALQTNIEDRIDGDLVDQLLASLDGVIEFPLDMSIPEVMDLWTRLTSRILRPFNWMPDLDSSVTRLALQTLRSEYNRWFKAQMMLVRHIDEGVAFPVEPVSGSAEAEMLRVIGDQDRYKFVLDDVGRLILGPDPSTLKYDKSSLSFLNMGRAAIRLLVQTYALDDERKVQVTGLTLEETGEAFADLRVIFNALGVLDENEPPIDSAISIFEEATMFMPRGDGDLLLDFEEGVDYLVSALAGTEAAAPFVTYLEQNCNYTEEGDFKLFDVVCFRQSLTERPDMLITHLTKIHETFLNLPLSADGDGPSKLNFIRFVESAVRDEGADPRPINEKDVSRAVIFLQYIESYVSYFDEDRSDVIDLDEALAAYPRFHRILKELSPIGDRSFVRALYTYLIAKGKEPSSVGDYFDFAWWYINQSQWRRKVNADRYQLVKVLGKLAEVRAGDPSEFMEKFDRGLAGTAAGDR
ncbi:MAG: hypothetical protein CL675_13785 [Bdellovibrionaceae bacterium]|nr:hypothetical protein [Pseudobdellovibrionaceae bacterium]